MAYPTAIADNHTTLKEFPINTPVKFMRTGDNVFGCFGIVQDYKLNEMNEIVLIVKEITQIKSPSPLHTFHPIKVRKL